MTDSSSPPAPAPPPPPTLRKPTVADKPAMRNAMHPFANGYFENGMTVGSTRVAEVADTIVGFIAWRGNQVLALYVAEQWRGQRMVGRLLLRAAEDAIQALGHRQVRVMIDADFTRAHNFYLRADYETQPTDQDANVAWMIKRIR